MQEQNRSALAVLSIAGFQSLNLNEAFHIIYHYRTRPGPWVASRTTVAAELHPYADTERELFNVCAGCHIAIIEVVVNRRRTVS